MKRSLIAASALLLGVVVASAWAAGFNHLALSIQLLSQSFRLESVHP